jgi:hypothetical protein
LPHQSNLCRSQAVGLVDEVAEAALQLQGFVGEGAGVRAEKLKLGKQSTLRSLATEDGKAEIARRRARRSAAASCLPKAGRQQERGSPRSSQARRSALNTFASWAGV